MSVLGIAVGLLLTVGLLGGYWGWKSHAAKTKGAQSGPPVLREESWSVRYAPGAGKAGLPMQLDILDVKQTLHLPFLVRAGMVGLKDQPAEELTPPQLGANGFPALELAWPSVHLPAADWCINQQAPTGAACPVFSMQLRSRPITEKDWALLNAKTVLADQESLTVTDRTVSLWTAFTTLTHDAQRLWAGWVCELDHLVGRNEDLHAWGLEEGVFPIDLADVSCHVPTNRLTRFWPELAYHWPTLGGYDIHPVIWQCPLRKGAACEVQFEHQGRLVTLELPGGVMLGDMSATKPAHQSTRPRLVQAAWAMLENAARQAENANDAPPLQQRWQQALQQELAWCERLSQHHTTYLQTQAPAVAQTLQKAWSVSPWLISSPHPRGPCARSFHRLAHLLEVAGASKTPATAFPAATWTQALAGAQRLAAVDKQQRQRPSEPVWRLVDELMMHHASATAPTPAAIAARLNWQNTPERLSRGPVAVWAMLEAAGDALTHMPVADVMRLRMNLAWALERKVREETDERRVSADDITTLFLQASQAWLSLPADQDPLSPIDSVALLTHTATHVRRFGHRPAADGSSRHTQAAQVLGTLIHGMERLAQGIAQHPNLTPTDRVAHLGTLAVHAAWHAEHLAWMPTQDTPSPPNTPSAIGRARPSAPPLDAAWVEWLTHWTQWQTSQLSGLPQGARLIAGVEVHRDAIRSGKRLSPDCPGAYLLGCKMAQP